MMDHYTRDVLERAARLTYLEAAARSMAAPDPLRYWRGLAAAALAALVALLPAAGAAQMLL
ncbi:MAG: hypothetical protein ACI4O7_15020 [Aristaeellaceae bacterium]